MNNPYQELAPADPPPPKPSLMQRLRKVNWEKAFMKHAAVLRTAGWFW